MLAVDIKVLGVPELERAMKRLETKTQRKIVRQALRRSAVRARERVVANLSNDRVQVQSGRLLAAMKRAKIRGTTRRGMIRVGMVFPTREELGIPASDKGYYPTAVEYGHGNVPAYPYMRPAIDEHKQSEFAKIGRDIGQGIEREAGK